MANTFPRWANWLPLKIVICLAVLGAGVTAGVTYYFTPKYTRVGYMPEQPVPFSHRIHVDQLGLDCRYCHSYVEKSKHSNVPATQTCMGCHQHVKRDSSKLELVRKNCTRPVKGFSFRGKAPLFDLAPFRLMATPQGNSVDLQTVGPDGKIAMEANAELAD